MPEQIPLDDRPLTRPAAQRLPPDHPGRADILAAHAEAIESGAAMYEDPVSGLHVLTARYLADRGSCCANGCRHCPYVRDAARLDSTAEGPALGRGDPSAGRGA